MKKLYGTQTEQALINFPYHLPSVSLQLIYAIVEIKKACARGNLDTGLLDITTSNAIRKSCDEILQGKHDEQFVTCSLQGGAGTSINMNVNEVVATLSSKYTKTVIHPNDHVNLSQSTNDVNPSALRITTIRLLNNVDTSLGALVKAFQKKARTYKSVFKLGRTHLQDAVPMRISNELEAYAFVFERNRMRLQEAKKYLLELNLGGTAIGNGINATKQFEKSTIAELKRITKLKLVASKNKIAATGSSSDFVHISNAVALLCNDLSKIAHDIRLLASGPNGGIAEIMLEERQPGSSIMPGKVNPVIPESMNQVYYFVLGKNVTIHQAAEAACLELAVMFPVLADSLITSIELTNSAIIQFTELCIKTLSFNIDRCRELLEKSTAYATLLTPILGYDIVAGLVKESVKKGIHIKKLILEKKLITEKQLQTVLKKVP